MEKLQIIKNIIKQKKSKICLAADVDNLSQLFKLIEEIGDKICILKIHYDIITDFFYDYNNTCKKLIEYKQKYNFLIWEDSKFGDIGHILFRKIKTNIIKWADLISIHPIAGLMSVNNIKDIGIILIGELSCKDNLINDEYKSKVIEISKQSNNIVGIVCQNKMTNDLLNITPGISITNKKDNQGQQYNTQKINHFQIYL